MNYIRIKTMANGYLASEDLSLDNPTGYNVPVYVFESYGNLIEWLRENLDKPKMENKNEQT